MQKEEANQLYSRFIDRNYEEIIKSDELLSHNLLKTELFPELKNQSYFLIVIDNLRYDQWLIIKPIVEDLFSIDSEGYTPVSYQLLHSMLETHYLLDFPH